MKKSKENATKPNDNEESGTEDIDPLGEGASESSEVRFIVTHSEEVPVESIQCHPMNANEGDVDEIAKSISELGMYAKITVNKPTGYIVKGNHTYQAVVKNKAKKIHIDWIDVDEPTELAILLRDNYTARKGKDDPKKVLAILERIKEKSPGQESKTGYQTRDVKSILEDIKKQDAPKSIGEMLGLTNICIEDPEHVVEKGEIYKLSSRHYLIIASVIDEHDKWVPFLSGKGATTLFCPNPGVFVPLTIKADVYDLVMAQPDIYIAGHILDRYAEVHGEDSIEQQTP
jgi:hypothetical protein